MTARQELEQMLLNHAMPGSRYCLAPHHSKLCDDLMAWHLRHQPSVSREQVEQVLKKHGIELICKCYAPHPYPIVKECVDSLLALLAPEEPKRWCPHWTWSDAGWKSSRSDVLLSLFEERMREQFTLCPFEGCAAPRPTEARG